MNKSSQERLSLCFVMIEERDGITEKEEREVGKLEREETRMKMGKRESRGRGKVEEMKKKKRKEGRMRKSAGDVLQKGAN
jgi:hypothetical protein